MDRPKRSPNNINFADAAIELLGTPWRPRGRTEQGLDCSGLIVLAARMVGLEIEPVQPKYDPRATPKRLIMDTALTVGTIVQPGDESIGLIAMCSTRRDRFPSHLAIRVDYRNYVHADMHRGGVVMSSAKGIQSKLVSHLRLNGLEWLPLQ